METPRQVHRGPSAPGFKERHGGGVGARPSGLGRNSWRRCGSQKGLGFHLKVPGRQFDHKKPGLATEGSERGLSRANQIQYTGRKWSLTPGGLVTYPGALCPRLPGHSPSWAAAPPTAVESSSCLLLRFWNPSTPLFVENRGLSWQQLDSPLVSSPACRLLSWSPAEAWPSAMSLACFTAFLSQGLDKKGSVLPMGTFKTKWEAAGTRKNPRKAASYRRNEDLESEPLDSGPSYPPPAPCPPLPPQFLLLLLLIIADCARKRHRNCLHPERTAIWRYLLTSNSTLNTPLLGHSSGLSHPLNVGTAVQSAASPLLLTSPSLPEAGSTNQSQHCPQPCRDTS